MCYYKWKKSLIEVVVKFRAVRFYHAPNILLRGTKYPPPKRLAIIIWKWKGSFQVHDLIHDYWKKYYDVHISSLWCSNVYKKSYVPKFPIFSALQLRSCEVVVFIDMDLYICSEDRNFKTFLKKNYVITVDSCYLFIKKMLTMELNLILILLMRFGNFRHSWNLQQIWWIPCNLSRLKIRFGLLVCNTLRFFFICLWEKQYFYKSQWLQITGKH